MNAYTKEKMDNEKKSFPEKYHHISAKKLGEFKDEPCYWAKGGVSFSDIERIFSSKYTFKQVNIYYATPTEIKKNLPEFERLNSQYLAGCKDSLFFFVKAEDINGDVSSEPTLTKYRAMNK